MKIGLYDVTPTWVWRRAKSLYGWPIAMLHEALHMIFYRVFGIKFEFQTFWHMEGNISYQVIPKAGKAEPDKRWKAALMYLSPVIIPFIFIGIYLASPSIATFSVGIYALSTWHALPSAHDYRLYKYYGRLDELFDSKINEKMYDFDFD